MTYYSLCGSVALSNITNITCLNFGLGSNEQSGKNILKIVSNDGGGSTLHSNNMNVLKEEEIEIKTLDSLNIQNIGFIKMDVEDNELFVLKGSIETLKQSNYPIILFESNYNNTELFDYIKYIGYNVIQIQGVTNMFLATR
jgi:FkbM family methyltransferase